MSREVPPAARLAGFAVVLTAALGAAYGVGGLVGASEPESVRAAEQHGAAEPHGAAGTPDTGPTHTATGVPPGLAVSQDGYTLRPAATILEPGPATPFTFTITGAGGRPVTAYEPTHERDLHLVVVRRDLTDFQHLHPVLGQDGRWSVPLDLTAAGSYRVFADFQPAGGEVLTLGTDVSVAGHFAPVPLPAPTSVTAVDGYEVTVSGTPRAGAESVLTFAVSRDGQPVTDLQPYLGAFGHLVALRAGDLAYLHTHPADETTDGGTGGPEVSFATTFPTVGAYRLHLDFKVGDRVHTAAFTVDVSEPGSPGDTQPTERDATERDATERDATERDSAGRHATERDPAEHAH